MGKGVLIDTDVLINYTRGLTDLPRTATFITEITLYEFVRGTREIERAKKLLEEGFGVIYHDNEVILKACEIWKSLKRDGEIVEDRDLLIAAAAIAKGLPLLTNNVRHFRRFEKFGLRIHGSE